jgi:hypothetical protein
MVKTEIEMFQGSRLRPAREANLTANLETIEEWRLL